MEHRLLAIEELNIKGLVRNKRLAKHIADAGWGQFVRMLGYKGEWYGCEMVADDRFFPSSKTCSQCGRVSPKSWRWECGSGTARPARRTTIGM